MVAKTKKVTPTSTTTTRHETPNSVVKEENVCTTHPPVEVPDKQYAMVDFSCGQTVNIGDYSSLKVNVGISYPVDVAKGMEVITSTFKELKEWVDTQLTETIDEYMRQLQESSISQEVDDVLDEEPE